MDIVFVFDESGSTRFGVTYTGQFQQKFALQRTFVIDIIDQFASIGTGAGQTSFGLVGFASGARIIQPMTGQRSVIVAAVESTIQGGGTNTAAGITTATNMESVVRGVSKLMIIVMDGPPSTLYSGDLVKANSAAATARSEGWTTLVVGHSFNACSTAWQIATGSSSTSTPQLAYCDNDLTRSARELEPRLCDLLGGTASGG